MTAILAALFLTAVPAQERHLPGVVDLKGNPADPFGGPKAKATVFIFLAVDCPIANRYAPQIARRIDEHGKKDVRFWLVYADRNLPPGKAAAHRKAYKLPDRVLLDRKHELVTLCRARVTPEAAVFDADRRLVYRGRIDDLYVAFGRARRRATTSDLRDAIEAVLQGKPVEKPHRPAIGCDIPDAPR